MPLPGTTDEIRDISGLTGVIDRAKGIMSVAQTGGADGLVTVPLPGVGKGREPAWLQVALVATLGLCTASLIVLKIQKSHRHREGADG